jgi:hypothetical protein
MDSTNWIKVLPKILFAINNTVSSATGLKPVDIGPDNAEEIWQNLYGNFKFKSPKKPKFRIGDTVRLVKKKLIFDKGYMPNYTGLLFIFFL